MWKQTVICMAVAWVLVPVPSHSARILGLFPFPARSHLISFTALTEELARRGHDVTVVSAFPRSKPLANYADIGLKDTFPEKDSMNVFDLRKKGITLPLVMIETLMLVCERTLQHPEIQKLMHGNEQYDLVLYEAFLSECTYPVLHRLKAPVIEISSNTITTMLGEPVGNPTTYSYLPDLFLGYKDTMNFKERLLNTLTCTFFNLFRNWYYLPKMEALARKYYQDPTLPSYNEIAANTSFLLLNSHFSLRFPRPLTPNTAEVGGMHIRAGKPLPKDLQKLLDTARHGVIYFSLGSNVRSADMPEEKRNVFLEAFSQLKETVVWKWETDTLPGQPSNVYLSKWLPQNDILAHPNVKVFITHGGLLSTQEATYFGMPLLAIPVAADQEGNARSAQDAGYAVMLEFENVTSVSLKWALEEVLNQARYREAAQRLSSLFRDKPRPPLETAVYWVEYVLRHKGARHLRSAALDLGTARTLLLDVLAVLLAVPLALLLLIACLLRKLRRPHPPVDCSKKDK